MNILESIILALDAVRINKLRASLTLLSISIGVFAIVVSGTLVSSIDNAVNQEMADMGENTIIIQKMPSFIMTGTQWRMYNKRKPITIRQFKDFKKYYNENAVIGAMASGENFTIENGDLSTNPDVALIGIDENYFYTNGVNVAEGRPMTYEDVEYNRNVALIGNDVVVNLFPNTDPIGKKIKVKSQFFEVIGVLEAKGAMLGQSEDKQVLIPLPKYLRYYSSEWEESLTLTVRSLNKNDVTKNMDEAIGAMRIARNLKPWEQNSFEVETNDSITEQFSGFTKYLSYFGAFCGAIALIAAGIGIMNIMLVSIKERTREIGIRKAIGARRSWILTQFIIETITLCQIGGIIGIGGGIGAGWLLGLLLKLNIALPWNWIIFSIVTCTLLGLFFGAYPAWKASKLDPIEALRYE